MSIRHVVVLFVFCARAWATDKPCAYLRAEPPEKPTAYYVEVGLPAALDGSRGFPSEIHATVYQNNERQLPGVIRASTTAPGDRSRFRIDLPGFLPETDGTPFSVAVRDFFAQGGSRHGWIIPVGSEVTVKLELDKGCLTHGMGPFSIAISVDAKLNDGHAQQRLTAIENQLKTRQPSELGQLRVEPRDRNSIEQRPIRNFRFTRSPDITRLCLETDGIPKVQKYDVEMAFGAGGPFELSKPLLLTDQPGAAAQPAIRAAQDKGETGTRIFERNLDMAALLSSAIKDSKQDNTSVRERQNQGTLDLRFAPVLNWQATAVKKTGIPIWFWTPFFIDAKVSTGSITKDTLSLNRIVAGTEVERRTHYTTKQLPTYVRQLVRLSNASDRDFKQAEYKIGYEFQPHLSFLNRPLSSNQEEFRNELDRDGRRPLKIIIPRNRIGYEFVPILGTELGRTYTQRRPAVPFPGEKFVRRFYVGGQITLNLTSYVKITVTDRFYIRGEAAERDLGHNYFNGEIEFPLGGLSAYVGQSLFLSFERGGQPPFATPDVNALKLGYRLLSNGWFGRIR